MHFLIKKIDKDSTVKEILDNSKNRTEKQLRELDLSDDFD